MDALTERKYKNSAIGSWSGFIYQGLCSINVVLHHIYEDIERTAEDYKDFSFYLDAFDDFSIHDASNKAVSLHQCKLYGSANTFKKDMKQLQLQRDKLSQDGLCYENANLYFHTNKSIVLADDIKKFKDCRECTTWDSESIIKSIEEILEKIVIKTSIAKNPRNIMFSLLSFVDRHVGMVHKRYIDNNKVHLWEIARDNESKIEYEEIRKIIFTSGVNSEADKHYFWLLVKFTFLHNLRNKSEECAEDEWEGLDEVKIKFLASVVGNYSTSEFESFLRRLIPTSKYTFENTTCVNTANENVIDDLITLVGQAAHQLQDTLMWQIKSKFQTPIVFPHNSEKRFIKALWDNSQNHDFLRESDWLVSHKIRESISDVKEKINRFDEVETNRETEDSDHRNNIFKLKKIGILTLSDFNDGNFE